jgi:hypothetical protein
MKKRLYRFTAFFSVLWALSCIPSLAAEDRNLKAVAAEYLGEQAQIGKQYALLIGIDRYQEWPGLKKPVEDAQDIRNILREHYYIDEFIELHDANATRANIARTFTDLQRRLGVHDSLFIYYAGHGYKDPGSQQGFWIPVNAGLDEYEQDNWLANSAIQGYIANLKTIHVFLVSDSCFSGDLLRTEYQRPQSIDNDYFRRAYTLVSRLVLTSGSSEAVPDESEFSQALKMCLLKNTEVLLDPHAIYSDVRLAVHETTPLLGSLERASHQDGATFIFFRRQPLQTAAQTAAAPRPPLPVQPPPAPSDWTPASDFDLGLVGEKGVTIKKYKGKAQRVNIPAVIDGSPVVEIGDLAFAWCSGLTSISIPSGVTAIGDGAFKGCRGLTSITVDTLNTRYSAVNGVLFSKDKKTLVCYPAGKTYTSYTIPSGVTAIGYEAFAGCRGLTSISIPAGVTAIRSSAFSGCSGLTSISIPSGVTAIGAYAFYGCSSLTSISIPSGVTAIGSSAFDGCSGLTSITVDALNTLYSAVNGVLFSKDGKTLVCYPAGKTYTSYTIPAGVTAIGSSAFYGCRGLTSISIPSSVTAIGWGAFSGCRGLTSISIPSGVTSIENYAFSGCGGLTSISIPAGVTSIGYGAFRGCSGLSAESREAIRKRFGDGVFGR